MRSFDPPGPVLVVSTHLDDAVLSCAQFIHSRPDTMVVTVFAGAPRAAHTGYNSATTGEAFAPDAIQKRKSEDAKALAMLGARAEWLEFEENDYLQRGRSEREVVEIRETIRAAILRVRPNSVLTPLGLYHVDHLDVANVCADIARQHTGEWYFYMDLPYGLAIPSSVNERIKAISNDLEVERLAPFSGDREIKDIAMRAYESQYGPTKKSHRRGFRATMRGKETYWNVLPARDSP